MMADGFDEARDALPSAIKTLPPDYLDGNAAPLLLIVEELKKSFLLELDVIHTIKRLDLTRADDALRWDVSALTQRLEDRSEARFSEERTHCGRIDLVARTPIAPHQLSVSDRSIVEEVERLLVPLREADREFVDELEPMIRDVLSSVQRINEHVRATISDQRRLKDARREQDDFARKFDVRMREFEAKANQDD
jgi:hypothetical protein